MNEEPTEEELYEAIDELEYERYALIRAYIGTCPICHNCDAAILANDSERVAMCHLHRKAWHYGPNVIGIEDNGISSHGSGDRYLRIAQTYEWVEGYQGYDFNLDCTESQSPDLDMDVWGGISDLL